jgi:uncharacterized FAD-dependent dehydrogenase
VKHVIAEEKKKVLLNITSQLSASGQQAIVAVADGNKIEYQFTHMGTGQLLDILDAIRAEVKKMIV